MKSTLHYARNLNVYVIVYRLLEVGALKPDNYASWDGWIDNKPIDLRSRHPSIQEQDFLLMDQDSHRAQWDAVSLSLVVNFVPDPHDRGTCLSPPSRIAISPCFSVCYRACHPDSALNLF